VISFESSKIDDVGESGVKVMRISRGGGNVGVLGNDSASPSPRTGDSGTSSSNGDVAFSAAAAEDDDDITIDCTVRGLAKGDNVVAVDPLGVPN